ncbi:hypothetical protein [Micromonospora pallida]|uniref:hypothetical protein n=1 Tax=Micromonospora pallida TaxID=145854 RepID=UPI00114CABA7|nr:hypothetical protein [Micromonospora pallida]
MAGEHQSLAGELHYNSLRMVELASILEDLFELDPSVLAEAPPMGTPAELRDFLLDKVSAGLGTIPGPDDVASVIDQY